MVFAVSHGTTAGPEQLSSLAIPENYTNSGDIDYGPCNFHTQQMFYPLVICMHCTNSRIAGTAVDCSMLYYESF